MPRIFLVLAVFVGIGWYSVADANCTELGFTEHLACKKCTKLAEIVKDPDLERECRSCCVEDAPEAQEYDGATLQICNCNLRHFPHVETFVNKDTSKHPKLEVQYVQGVRPTLVMKRPDGQEDVISVMNWKTEHLNEFLTQKLR
eukprot:TRINITY_DN1937_c0_g1_i1.p1 TRINITY_DN1937_c0_g1~~TRINITY_DN1937_c0_g1_i1.p1  ORF type:complete len:151 (-),score=20.99 TRINITY_DN1937_c0_g1_i1:435-866(-)